MYIHRLIIDANCINAKGQLPAMTALQEYHDVGALELLVTSTLPIEFENAPFQAEKAAQYQKVGGLPFYLSGISGPQSEHGTPVRPSLFTPLFSQLFGFEVGGDFGKRSARDCLHIDQAQMNAADVFITNDNKLREAEPILTRCGVRLLICNPAEALEYIRSYFATNFGSHGKEHVAAIAHTQGPVIFGSCSTSSCRFIADKDDEVLGAIHWIDGHAHMNLRFRDEAGQLLLDLVPGKPPRFPDRIERGPEFSLHLSGRGPVILMEENAWNAVVSADSKIRFAARTTHTGRVVISEMELRDQLGQIVVRVDRESLLLSSGSVV